MKGRRGLDVGILCQGWYPDRGGVESHTRDLARELQARGHRVHVLCLDYSGEREPYSFRREVLEEVDVTRMAYLYHDHRALADVVVNHRAEGVVRGWLSENPCDVVHVHHATGFGLGSLRVIRSDGTALVMTLHDYWSLCPRGQMVRSDGVICSVPEEVACAACIAATWPHLLPGGSGEGRGPEGEVLDSDEAAVSARAEFALSALRQPERLLTPSEAAKSVYVRAGLEAERIEVCENGIEVGALAREVARMRRARDEQGVRKGLRLGVLGSVLPSKGTLELARAFRAARIPDMTLVIHGDLPSYHGDPGYVDSLRALAAEDESVLLKGPYAMDELPAILADLDAVAAPSRWEEVYGLTVREAVAAGLPVFVSAVGDLPAVTRDESLGLVIPAADEQAWISALRRFAAEPALRASWSKAPRDVRSAHAMTLQVERAYVAAIRQSGADVPELVHPVGVEAKGRPGLLRRLFGRGLS